MWWDVLIGLAATVLAIWLALVAGLFLVRPKGALLGEAIRILPDLIRLLGRLAGDRDLPLAVRVRISILMAYLACPVDLIPDFIPVLGYADDAIIVAAVLRGTVHRAGLDAVRSRWPGTPDGFTALCKLSGLAAHPDPSAGDDQPTVR